MQTRTCENSFRSSFIILYVNIYYLSAFMHAYLKEVIFTTYTFIHANAISVRRTESLITRIECASASLLLSLCFFSLSLSLSFFSFFFFQSWS